MSFDLPVLNVNSELIRLQKNIEEIMSIMEGVRLNNITLFYKMRFQSDKAISEWSQSF